MRVAISAIALLTCASLASAADLGKPSYGGSLKDEPTVAAPATWTGLYVGAHAGYGWGEHSGTGVYADENVSLDLFDGSFDLEGALAGGQIGFNLQSGSFLIGIEGDGSWANIDGSGSFSFDQGTSPAPDYTWNLDTKVDWLASLRGRIGLLATPALLIYGTAGVAWAGLETHSEVICHQDNCPKGNNPTTVLASASETAVGWVAGLGAEWQFGRGWSLKAEWQHYEFDDVDGKLKGVAYPNNDPKPMQPNYTNDTFPGDVTIDAVRVGVNYKFGG